MFWTSLLLFISMAGAIGPSVFSNYTANAQLLNDRDNDAIEDENDPCPDNPDTQCSTPETPADLPGINAPIDQGQEQDGGEQVCTGEAQVCTEDEQVTSGISESTNAESTIPSSETSGEQVANVCTGENQSAGEGGGETNVCTGEDQSAGGVTIPSQYQKILDKLDQLALIADNDGIVVFGSPNFDDAVRAFRNDLASQLKTNDLSRPIPHSALAITVEALKLWVDDDGKTWGTSDDTDDFVSSTGCYATVEGDANKCNIYVAEVIYRATGVTFKEIPEENLLGIDTGKYIPFRARDWATPTTKIPNFQVTSNSKMGDIWAIKYPRLIRADSGHVGIYLGEYYGVKIYVSARSEPDGVYGIGSIQHEDGIQVKELIPTKGVPKGGTYREYSP
jgi:hypothetical protein